MTEIKEVEKKISPDRPLDTGFSSKQREEIESSIDKLCDCIREAKLDEVKNHVQFLKDNLVNYDYYIERVLGASREAVANCIRDGNIFRAKEIIQFVKDEFQVEGKELYSDEVLPTAREGVANFIRDGWISGAKEIIEFMKEEFEVNGKDLCSDEVLVAVKEALAYNLREGVARAEEIIEIVKEEFEVNSKELYSDEMLSAAREGFAMCLRYDAIPLRYVEISETQRMIKFMKEEFEVNCKELYSNEVLANAKERIGYCLGEGELVNAREIFKFMKERFGVNSKDLCSAEVLIGAKKGVGYRLSIGEAYSAHEIIEFMKEEFEVNLYSDEVLIGAKNGVGLCLTCGYLYNAQEIIKFMKAEFKVNSKELYSDEVLANAKERIGYCLGEGDLVKAHEIIEFMKTEFEVNSKELYSDEVLTAAKDRLAECLRNGGISDAKEIIEFVKDEFQVDSKELYSDEVLSAAKEVVAYYLSQGWISDAREIIQLVEDKFKVNSKNFKIDISDKEKLFKYLIENDNTWKDRQICEPFKRGIEYFGYDLMFEYIDERHTSLHDKMIGFNDICNLCDKFCATPETRKRFINNILKQVKMDGSQYKEGTSYHHFNAIARDLNNASITNILEQANGLQETLPEIEELVSFFSDESKVMASWKNLKKFMKLKEFVDDVEIINELAEIKKKDEKLFEYAKVLLFHKGSNVDLSAVREFLYDPEEFFRRRDAHSSKEIHDAIKPSNFYEHGLSAEELVQAIVSGALDEIQEIRPMEIEYEVREHTTIEYLSFALGKKSQGIRGEASDPRRIFSEIKKLNLNLKAILEGSVKLTKEDEEKIISILKEDANMKKKILKETSVYKAQIHRKSDPMATLVGDDTACCMSFGSGKGNIYYFTPNNAIFSLQKKVNGEFRTIAQSVITLDIDAGVTGINSLKEISKIPEEAFKKKLVLTCDNIEVAPNFYGERGVIEEGYRQFFRSYMTEYAESIGVEDSKIIIGKGFSDAFTNLPTIENTFIPTSLLGYSDNRRSRSYILDLNEESKNELSFTETRRAASKKHEYEKSGEYTIQNICLSDIIKISRLENDVYGESLKEGMVEMQNTITAYLIKNALAKKEGFMFKMMDKEGMLSSYIIAREEAQEDRKEVYISDFASKGSSIFLNGRMIIRFFEKYMRQYGNDDTLPVITAEFRESTSYKFIEDEERLNKFLKRHGLRAKVVEDETEERGGETFHKCTIYVIRENEDNSKFDEIISSYENARNNVEDYDNED